MMPVTELEERVRAAQARNERAFQALVESFYPLVFGLALSGTGNRGDAEDVAQDAFVTAWTHLHRLRNPRAFPAWLRQITRNLARTCIRSHVYRRRLRAELAAAPKVVPTNQESAMERVAREDIRRDVMAMLQEVSPRAREALVMFYLEQRSVAEASALLGIRENAFKVRLHAGRQQLRAAGARRAEEELSESLAPPDVASQTSRIMAGLAAGPLLAAAADAAAKTGIGLSWIESVQQSVVWDHIVWGGLIVSKKIIVTAGAIAFAFALGLWWHLEGNTKEPVRPVAVAQDVQAASHFEQQRESSGSQSADAGDSATGSEPVSTATSIPAAPDAEEKPTEIAAAPPYARPEIGRISDPAAYASISGFVIDARGQPVPGASVRAIVSPGMTDAQRRAVSSVSGSFFEAVYAGWNRARYYTARSDRYGAYSISGLTYEGNVRVRAGADGYYCEPGDGDALVVVKAGDALTQVNLVLDQGVTFYGRVLSPQNEPVPNALVQLTRFRSKGSTRTGALDATITDDAGEFQTGFVRAGEASFAVSSAEHGDASFEAIQVGDEARVDLRMATPAAVAGTIAYSAGGPAAGVEVRLLGWGSELPGNGVPIGSADAALTDAAGAYRLENLDPRQTYQASVYSRDGEPLSAPEQIGPLVEGTTTRWDATLEAAIVVTGHVHGATTGKPMRDIKVAAIKDGELVEGSATPVGADGSYLLSLLSGSGEYVIVATPWRIVLGEIDSALGVPIALEPGQTRVVDLTFPDTFTMSVRAVNSAGYPVEGVTTGIGEDDSVWVPAGKTDEDGRFVWAGFRAGARGRILIGDGRTPRAATDTITGEAGVEYPEQVIVLRGDGGVEGVALDGTGAPLANGLLMVEVISDSGAPVEHQAPTDQTGHFLIGAGVPATSVVLQITGYTEDANGINRYTTGEVDVTAQADGIVDLGEIQFQLEESGIQL